MTDLSELLARVEKAEGPDRELDALIACAVDPETMGAWEPSTMFPNGGLQRIGQPGWTRDTHRFSASVDAALALVERVLPGCSVYIHATRNVLPKSVLWPDEYGDPVDGYARTPALTVVAALLKAREGQAARPKP